MEDNRNQIFSNRSEPSFILYIGTVIIGSIILLIGYFLSRYTRFRNELDSTKDGQQNQDVDPRDSFPGSSSTANVNRRVKNKKRREVPQEFSHSWVVGTLKGHTSNIFNMSFSSNGKHLASCAEDCKRPNGMMRMMGTVGAAMAATMERRSKAATLPARLPPSYPSPSSFAPNLRRNINLQPPPIRRYRDVSNQYAGYKGGMMIKYESAEAAAVSAAAEASFKRSLLRPVGKKPTNNCSISNSNSNRNNNSNQQTNISRSSLPSMHESSKYQRQQQFYIPEYNQNKNVLCKLNHYQQKARDIYFHQLYVQLIQAQHHQQQQPYTAHSIVPQNAYHCPIVYHQHLAEQLAGQLASVKLTEQLGPIDIETNDHTTTSLYSNVVSPYWMEGRYPSKQTYGFVQTKRNEFIINDTILEYVLRTYVHHPLYLIEAGYPCAWNFDARFKQFVNNLHKPFVSRNNQSNVLQQNNINNIKNNLVTCTEQQHDDNNTSSRNNNNNNNNNDDDDNNSIDKDEQQNRECVRSSSFTSSSRSAYINETMIRQRSSSISSVGELDMIETRCAMCLKDFYLYRANGEVDRQEVCVHHPGDLIFNNKDRVKTWTCCRNRASVLGCKTESSHVWKSFKKNFASPQIDFVRTKPSEIQPENRIYGIYGIDCEMVTTQSGLELAKVSLVNIHGHVVYNEYVIPESDVIDYNTRFSGITPNQLATATKTLHMVQQDLLEFIKAETILIGHALENDLKVLKMIHYTCIDTALLLKHPDDLPFRHSLRVLSKGYLNRIIQRGSHNSVEDTLSALDLVLFKLRDDGF